MRKKVKNGFLKTVILSAVMLAMFGHGMTSAMAGDSHTFDFNFTGNGYWDVTEAVAKNNASYVSMKCTYAEVQGSCYDAVVVAYPGEAQCCPRAYRFYEDTYQLMTNYVYEQGYRMAGIDAWCVDDVDGQGAMFSGYWYADSDIY